MWTDDYAAKLAEASAQEISLPDEDSILDFTRRVAHGTERKNAPLATFLAGWYVAGRVAGGADPATAWKEAARLGNELLDS
ncbi:MAG: hypothetical protein HKN74_06220 [Acidimicrobiia bacterium]|nr:hypothetical protein [Acidimicrobiia bacterium]